MLERHKYYVSQHTLLTTQALEWSRNQSLNHYLLVGKERQAAEEWLLVKFQEGEQAPCTPCDLLCDFICESRKNAENRMTDCFICYDYADKATRNLVVKALARHAITTWRHDNDIQHGSKAEQAILSGIAGADNVVYFISPNALTSEVCNQELSYAHELNKRIIPLLIKATPNLPADLQQLQYIHFVEDQQHGFAELLRVLHIEHHYYEQHKMLLARALEWQAGAFKTSFLLRGYNLENAKTWLRLNQQREQHPPTALHVEFITASEAAKERLGTEVFLSYSRKDGDFARKLNRALQESGKTVWFDQESISSGANFELELYKGIQNSDNFLFVISPDSATSPYCESEVNYAVQQGKRVVSVLCRETEPSNLPETLKFINWIDFAQQDFDKQFPELIQTLELDREHAHQHTVLQQRANEWQDNHESNDFLLNISACGKAETWLKAATDKQPRATELQESYIQSSREAIKAAQRKEQRRQRVVLGSVLMGLVIAIVLAAFSWDKSVEAEQQKSVAWAQKKEADKQTEIAKKNYTKARINNLVNIANQQIKVGDYTRALRVAQEAYELNPNPQEPMPAVEQALSDTYNDVVLNKEGGVYKDSYSNENKRIESSDGNTQLVYKDGADSVQLLSSEGKILNTLEHGLPITDTLFSEDSYFILTLGRKDDETTLKLWDSKGNFIKTLLEKTDCVKGDSINCHVRNVTFTQDNYIQVILSYTSDKEDNEMNTVKLYLWDSQGNLLKTRKVNDVTATSVSKNGQYTAFTLKGENKLRVTRWHKGSTLASPISSFTCGGSCNFITSIQLTSDGDKLLGHSFFDSMVYIFMLNNPSRKEPLILSKHQSTVLALSLAPDEKTFATGDEDGNIIIWNMNGEPQGHVTTGAGRVRQIVYSKDGKKLLSSHKDKTVKLWEIEVDEESLKLKRLANYTGYKGDITNITFIRKEQLIETISNSDTSKLWSVTTESAPIWINSTVYPLQNDGDKLLAMSKYDDNTLMTVWSIKEGKILQHYALPLSQGRVDIQFLGISPNAKYFVTSREDKKVVVVRVHHIENGELVHEWKINSYCSIENKCDYSNRSHRPYSLIFSADGQFIIGGNNQGEVIIWKITGEYVNHFSTGKQSIYLVAVSSNSHYLATSDTQSVKIWDFSGKLVRVLPNKYVRTGRFSPDEQYLAIVFGHTAEIVSVLHEKAPIVELKGHTNVIETIDYHHSGKYLVTGSVDKTAKIWTTQGKQLRTLGYTDSVNETIFTKDGDIITSTGYSFDSVTRIWPSPRKIYEWAKNNKDIYQLTDADRKELGMIEE